MDSFCTGEWLECTGCGEHFGFPLSTTYVYCDETPDLAPDEIYDRWSHGEWIPVLKRRAWCIKCNAPVLAERIPTDREFVAAAAVARDRIEAQRLRIEPAYGRLDDELVDLPLDMLTKLYSKVIHRTARPKCLQCGTTEWFAVSVENGALQPLLHHETCGSDLKWHGVITSRNGRFPLKVYSWDGDLISSAWTP